MRLSFPSHSHPHTLTPSQWQQSSQEISSECPRSGSSLCVHQASRFSPGDGQHPNPLEEGKGKEEEGEEGEGEKGEGEKGEGEKGEGEEGKGEEGEGEEGKGEEGEAEEGEGEEGEEEEEGEGRTMLVSGTGFTRGHEPIQCKQ